MKIDLPLGTKHTTVTLCNALYAPKMAFMLVSMNRITAAGLAVHFEGHMCRTFSAGPRRMLITKIPQVHGLYTIATHPKHHANIAKGQLTLSQAHHILGHISQSAVKQMAEVKLVEGMQVDTSTEAEFCDVCMKAKATCQPFPNETKNHARTYAELVHTECVGTSTDSEHQWELLLCLIHGRLLTRDEGQILKGEE